MKSNKNHKRQNMRLKVLPSNENALIQTDADKKFYDMLIRLYADNPTKCAVRIMSKHKTQYSNLREWIFAKTSRIKNTKSFAYKMLHRFIWIFQGLSEFPKCPTCRKRIGFKDNVNCFNKFGYDTYCSRKCANENSNKQAKTAKSFMRKYGVDHQMKIPSVKNKVLETQVKNNNALYGCDYYFQTDEFRAQYKNTSMKNYGVPHPMQSKRQYRKFVKGVEKKYGVKNVAQIPGVNEKRLNTLYKNTGSLNPHFSYEYDGIHFDSSWELALWIFYTDHGSKIKREPVVLEFEFMGKLHKCTPDFEIDGQLVEVKGNMFFEDRDPTKKMIYPYKRKNMSKMKYKELNDLAEVKHQFMLSQGVIYITDKDIMMMKRYVQDHYGKNYLKPFKV